MEAAQFAEFWRMQGQRVIETSSCYWHSPYPLVFMSLPYHRPVNPSRGELLKVVLAGPSAAIRFHYPAGTGGGLFICSDRGCGLHSLQRKARNQTRRGLEECTVERLDFAYLARHGSALNEQSFLRQGRDSTTVTDARWNRYCDAASQIRGFEAWGALVQGRLAAFMVTALVEDHFSILHQSSATTLLQYYPNNALTFTVTRLKLSYPEVACVSYGLKSLDYKALGNERFKMNMGFELRPFGECLIFNPLLKPFLTSPGRKTIHWLARNHPRSDFWRRASGVLQEAGA